MVDMIWAMENLVTRDAFVSAFTSSNKCVTIPFVTSS